ncbi:hypothetical protein [Aurantibacter sp.]|uniref:hypothetical protein n=1 Tax=Aurantibacter sp. TaxID=2807103 RepID=UPI00326500B9
MVRKFSILLLVTLSYTSCDDDDYDGGGCEDGYIKQYGADGMEWCIEGYIEDEVKEYNSGESYFHKEHGLITFTNGIWVNKHNQVIKP